MKTTTKWITALYFASLFFLFFACSKNNSLNSGGNIPPGKSQISVFMMDDPIAMLKVLIDIRQVAVEIDTATKQSESDSDDQWDDNFSGRHRDQEHKSVFWDTLSIKPGAYDLLKWRNGTDTLLASGIFPSGKIIKVRITLGSDNTVYTDSSTSYPLAVSGSHPYFDINVRKENVSSVSSNQFKLWIDFNLAKSIFFSNGQFLLKPNLLVFNDEDKAKIKGTVLPERSSTLVRAMNMKDTLYAIPGEDGKYMFRDVSGGTYSVVFKGEDGYQDTTISQIVVGSRGVTIAPTITLHK